MRMLLWPIDGCAPHPTLVTPSELTCGDGTDMLSKVNAMTLVSFGQEVYPLLCYSE